MAKRLVGVVDTVPFHNNFVVGMTGNSNNLNYDALAWLIWAFDDLQQSQVKFGCF